MRKASESVSTEQRERVAAAVSAAEQNSVCEIVPVVATASGRYDRAEDIVGLWCAMLGATAIFLTLPGSADFGHWGGLPVWAQVLLLCSPIGFTVCDCYLRLVSKCRKKSTCEHANCSLIAESTIPTARRVF
jgi:hypothetical protein